MKLLEAWVALVVRRAGLVLTAIALLTIGLGYIAVTEFRLNADLSKLITQKAPWRIDFDSFQSDFPDLVKTAVVVVEGKSLKQIELTSKDIVQSLVAHPEYFRAVSAPGIEPFFRDHALLYMDLDTLDDTADKLAQAQPWLSAVSDEPSLRGLFGLLEDAIANDPPEGFGRVLDLLTESGKAQINGNDATIWWSDELLPVEETQYQLIYLKAAEVDGTALPDAQVVAELREIVQSLVQRGDVQVSLTGELALQHEEIEAAVGGVTLAGWLALGLLLIVLVLGVRSGKIIAATFTMLAIGVIWTSAYAMLTVGEYNTLSVVFVVMFFGLGVDFALHYSLRFQEATNECLGDQDTGDTRAQTERALLTSTRSVGRAISLCSVTTALGFLGFWPTDYQGLADLGVISAGGMAIAWILTFTFLPAFYALSGPPRFHRMDLPTSDAIVSWLLARRSTVVIGVFALGVGACFVAAQSAFDYSVLALKDPSSESMRTLRVLQAEGLSTDYQLVHVNEREMPTAPIQALDVVKEVRVPADRVPSEQDEKLFVLDELQLMLFDALSTTDTLSPTGDEAVPENRVGSLAHVSENRAAARRVLAVINEDRDASVGEVSALQLQGLANTLALLDEAPDEAWREWESAVVANLLEELQWIRKALVVEEIGFSDLPVTVRERLVTQDGKELMEIVPAQDIAPVQALSQFLTDVRTVLPHATGRPVIEWGVGGIVVGAFKEALVLALLAISITLLIVLRRPRTVLLILYPLGLAAVFTMALGVFLNMPLNMASILVLPLIFGLGVDNGIHVVDRYLGEGDVDHLMHSSTPRAVMLSTLTTIGAFAALSVSPHAGTASIGLLLTIAIGFLLLFTIFLLPVLLSSKLEAVAKTD